MYKYLKTSIYLMIFTLLVQLFPSITLAEEEEETDNTQTEVVLFAIEEGDEIELYEDHRLEKMITSMQDGTSVKLLEVYDDYSKVQYFPVVPDDEATEPSAVTGFVSTVHVVHLEDVDEFLHQRTEENLPVEEVVEEEVNEEPEIEIEPEDVPGEEESIEEAEAEPEDVPGEIDEDIAPEETELQNELPVLEAKTEKSSKVNMLATSEIIKGVALKAPTKVYSEMSSASSALKSYKQGHILQFRALTADWYTATVYISGKARTGYIHVNDVDVLIDQQRIVGYATVQPVHVYQNATRADGVLKSYNHGAKLIYRTYSSQWHQATVIINGKSQTGYIHKKDVSAKLPTQVVSIKGLAVADRVSVFSTTSASSAVLKSYSQGHILLYQTFNNAWYQATVYVNGQARTGYIRATDVETINPVQTALKGIGTKSPTKVYASATTNSSALKSYSQGHILHYKTFTSGWYEARIIINGKARTGYIKASDVENVVGNQQTIKGVGIQSPTHIFSKASTSSKVLKSYSFAKGLIYRTFSDNWYEATVYVNGKATTGYIHKSHVVDVSGKRIVLDPGHGGSDPGAQASGIVEKNLNLDISLRTRNLLRNAGFDVVMTRTTDVFVALEDRAAIANSSNADIFISIHGNSFNGAALGVETFWYGKYEQENSIRLAHALQDNVVRSTTISYRRVAEGNYHVIRETKIPSALLEVGFIDNPIDAAKLKQSKYKQLAAEGIMLGILDYYK